MCDGAVTKELKSTTPSVQVMFCDSIFSLIEWLGKLIKMLRFLKFTFRFKVHFEAFDVGDLWCCNWSFQNLLSAPFIEP